MDKLERLEAALRPLMEALKVNDSDTLSRLRRDDKVLWTATGSWSRPTSITLGDLRAIRAALAGQ